MPAKWSDQFSAVVQDVAERYGVKVAAIPAPAKNPYAMTPKKAAEVAVRAGIITPAGKLTRKFR